MKLLIKRKRRNDRQTMDFKRIKASKEALVVQQEWVSTLNALFGPVEEMEII